MLSFVDWLSGLVSFLFLLSPALGGREASDADLFVNEELTAKPVRSQFVPIQVLSPRARRVVWQDETGKENTFILQISGPIDDHGDHSRLEQPEEVLQGHEMILDKKDVRRHLWEQHVLYENPGPDFETLSTQLHQGAWEATRVSKLFVDLVAFVEHAHREGVNLAPIGLDNVLVGPEGKVFKLVGLRYAGLWRNDHSLDYSHILHGLFAQVMDLCNLSRDKLDPSLWNCLD